MTAGHSPEAEPPQLSIRDRQAILDKVLATLEKRFYRPEKLDDDWRCTMGSGSSDYEHRKRKPNNCSVSHAILVE